MTRARTEVNEFGTCTLNGKPIYKRNGLPLKPGDPELESKSMFQVVEHPDHYAEDTRGRHERRRSQKLSRKKK